MRHICIYKCIVNHWNAVYSLWCYSHTWTVLFFVAAVVAAAWTSSKSVVAAATTARHHIWSPGVSVASISRYLLVFYYKLFCESTLNKEYITEHNIILKLSHALDVGLFSVLSWLHGCKHKCTFCRMKHYWTRCDYFQTLLLGILSSMEPTIYFQI